MPGALVFHLNHMVMTKGVGGGGGIMSIAQWFSLWPEVQVFTPTFNVLKKVLGGGGVEMSISIKKEIRIAAILYQVPKC